MEQVQRNYVLLKHCLENLGVLAPFLFESYYDRQCIFSAMTFADALKSPGHTAHVKRSPLIAINNIAPQNTV